MEGCDWHDDVGVQASIREDNLYEEEAQVIEETDEFKGLTMTPNHSASPLTSRNFASPLSMSPACIGMTTPR